MDSDHERTQYSEQETYNREKFCKSTTYLEKRRSRITHSFIKANESTIESSFADKATEDFNKYLIPRKTHSKPNVQIWEKENESDNSEDDSIASENESFHQKKLVTFSIYLNKKLTGKREVPVMFKESFEVDVTDVLDSLLINFITALNKKLKKYEYMVLVPEMPIDEKKYVLKPMKKSGKPDMDLPGFDLKTKLLNFGVSSFSLVFHECCLVDTQMQDESFDENFRCNTMVMKGTDKMDLHDDLRKISETVKENEESKKIEKKVIQKETSCCNKCIIF